MEDVRNKATFVDMTEELEDIKSKVSVSLQNLFGHSFKRKDETCCEKNNFIFECMSLFTQFKIRCKKPPEFNVYFY